MASEPDAGRVSARGMGQGLALVLAVELAAALTALAGQYLLPA